MANCSLGVRPPGNGRWNKDRIRRWLLLGGALGALLAFLQVADLGVPSGLAILWVIGFIFFSAIAIAVFVAHIVNVWAWFRDRLKKQNPETITIAGLVVCKRRNLDVGLPNLDDPSIFEDGDWNFNVDAAFNVLLPLIPGLDAPEVRTRAAPGSGQPQAYRAFQEEGEIEV